MKSRFLLVIIFIAIVLSGCSNSKAEKDQSLDEKGSKIISGSKEPNYLIVDSTGDESFEILDIPVSDKKGIYLEITKSIVASKIEADEQFPYFYLLPGDTSFERVKKSNEEKYRELESIAFDMIASKHKLTLNELNSIKLEGEKENWVKYSP